MMSDSTSKPTRTVEITPEARDFGEYLRNLRRPRKMNQAELAQMVGIASGYYGFFEQGRQIPSLKIISRLASVLDVDYMEMALKAGYDETEARRRRDARRGDSQNDSPDAAEDDDDGRNADDAVDAHSDSHTQEQTNATQTPQDKPSSSNVDLGLEHLDGARLDWAMSCITSDPTFKLSDQFTQGVLANSIKALVIQLYQAQTGRQLLTSQEFQELNHMVHG